MRGRELIVAVLDSHYDGARLLRYAESDDEICFQLPAPLRDAQTAAFRSPAAVLNELAISHRLSLLFGRDKCGVPEDFAFAIKSVVTTTTARDVDVVDEYQVSLRFEIVSRRRGTVTALRSTLATAYRGTAHLTTTAFDVLPPSLAKFVRQARHFADFAEVKISREESELSPVAGGHFRYSPSEADRLSDGRRVDHVPALTLIDIALVVDGPGMGASNISAEFSSYADPRSDFDVFRKSDRHAIEFVQDGRLVAIVSSEQPRRSGVDGDGPNVCG